MGTASSLSRAGSRTSTEEFVRLRRRLDWFYGTVLTVLGAMFLNFVATNEQLNLGVTARYLFHPEILNGVKTTLILTACGMFGGILAGAALAVMRLSESPILRGVSAGAIYVSRTIPLLVQLLFWFYLASVLPQISFGIPFGPAFVSLDTNAVIGKMSAAIIGLALFEAGYMAEIMRAGILSVDTGQVEAAVSLGMSQYKIMRRVVLPQAARTMVPPTVNQVIALLKYSSIVLLIGIADVMFAVQTIYARNFQQIPLLLVATFWYGLLTILLTVLQARLEKRFSAGVRASTGKRTRPKERESV